jgi:hypothetical protein
MAMNDRTRIGRLGLGVLAGLATGVAIAVGCADLPRFPAIENVDDPDAMPSGTPAAYSCGFPHPGCGCPTEGEQVACGTVEATVAGQSVCGAGLSVCTEGRWGACIINNAVTLVPQPKPHTTHADKLGGPVDCANNPCDPFCITFLDDPSGLTSADAGIAAQDGGLTLLDPIYGAPPSTNNCTGGTLGTCAHSICSAGVPLTTGCDAPLGCVATVCAAHPMCCGVTWDSKCVAWAQSACNIACGSKAGACVVCYKDSVDHDGDGFSYAQGDCADCDPAINPGAYDYPGNGIDEDCNGTPDDEVTSCDGSLLLASSTAGDYARAIDLCRTTTAAATGSAKTWGVISAKLVQADGTSAPAALGSGIMAQFGPNNLPQKGARMAAFSSGTARSPADTGWVNPNGQATVQQGYLQGTSCNYPTGFPKNKTGCANATGPAHDSTGLLLSVRVPTNASSFTYRFNFFTSEYPEYVCNAFNDSFVALLTTTYVPANPAKNSLNISFDANGNPVNVNNGFFTVTSGPQLTSTGFDGLCKNPFTHLYDTCGGGTGWLQTSAPVVPGEILKIQFSIWDSSDELWDSIVLVDDWAWSASPATIQTGLPPPPPQALYSPGVFVRDYDATGLCNDDELPTWGLWSWNSATPLDSSIAFTVQVADSQAGLDAAPVDPLLFSDPPGPTALLGQPIVAHAGPPSTNAGSAVVDDTLLASSRAHNGTFLRVTSQLAPSTNLLAAPTLSAWNLQLQCVTAL